jgi:dipeptidase E
MRKLLLLSNSTMPGTSFFTWPRPWVKTFLGEKPLNLIFIPYAAVTFPFDEYEANVRKVFNEMQYAIFSIHGVTDKRKAIEKADGIVIGGGNTFALLHRILSDDLLEIIQEKVSAGTPYIGWSAGSNLACPTIMTTNDMPIVQPASFKALNLVPFQINPHYHELRFENQGGETRKERINEFLVMNPHRSVIGLPEGMLLQVEDDHVRLDGEGSAKLYQANKAAVELTAGTDLSNLLADSDEVSEDD